MNSFLALTVPYDSSWHSTGCENQPSSAYAIPSFWQIGPSWLSRGTGFLVFEEKLYRNLLEEVSINSQGKRRTMEIRTKSDEGRSGLLVCKLREWDPGSQEQEQRIEGMVQMPTWWPFLDEDDTVSWWSMMTWDQGLWWKGECPDPKCKRSLRANTSRTPTHEMQLRQ